VHHGDISVENRTDEQNPNVGNPKVENSIPNLSNSEETTHVINVVNASPMNRTPLYIFFLFFFIDHKMNNILIREYSCWSRHRTATAVWAFLVFTSLVIVVVVLAVWFTTKKTSMFFVFS
jgi:hypothetical protein